MYEKLAFIQYFIDNSEDWGKTGKASREVKYSSVPYFCNSLEKLIGLKHEVNYEVFYDNSRNVIQINFQKTNGKTDWFANIFEFSNKYYDAITFEGRELQLQVHHGWGHMYKSIKKIIRSEWENLHTLHPDAETEVIGWSLGSGQAVLCSQDLNYNFGVKTHLFTYGSVRPFASKKEDRELLKRYLSTVCAECYNFANINDIVTYMPPFNNFTTIRRVDVGLEEPRTFKKLLNPNHYHTIYDDPSIYQITNIQQNIIAANHV